MLSNRSINQLFILALLGLSAMIPGLKAQSNATVTQRFHLPKLINANDDGFIVIGHRGASAYYPENTMPAFEAAVEQGAEMIELDVQLSKDGIPVVFHDARLQRTTNGVGWTADRTLGELKQLDAGSWFKKKFAGTRIPTLEEVLQYAEKRVALNIEIKTEAVTDSVQGGIEQKCLKLVARYGMDQHVLFSSFNYRAIEHLKELAPDMPVALLHNAAMAGKMRPSEQVERLGADAFNCSKRELVNGWLKDLRDHNIPVFVYTVNQRRFMKQLVKKGVAGIFTNKPDLLAKVVQGVKGGMSGKQT